MIYAIGDSHALCNFSDDPRFTIHHLGPITMYRFGKERVCSLNSMRIEDGSWIVWSLGEIDVRNHIFKWCAIEGKSIFDMLRMLVDNYFARLDLLKSEYKKFHDMGLDFMLLAVPPPTDYNVDPAIPRCGSLEDRIQIRGQMNAMLYEYSKAYFYEFLDPYKIFEDEKGILKKEYTDESVHIDKGHTYLVRGQVYNAISLYKSH